MVLRNKDLAGFTLIEIIIIVAIIGILAAIAIPNFTNYQLKAKTAEAKTNLGAIKNSQITFKTEWSAFIPCAPTLANPSTTRTPWPISPPGFTEIGFEPSGDVYYNYEVAVAGGILIANIAQSGLNGLPDAFCASANSNLDGDTPIANHGEYGFANDIITIATTSSILGSVTQNGITQDVNPGNF